jgi:hypothetical protein
MCVDTHSQRNSRLEPRGLMTQPAKASVITRPICRQFVRQFEQAMQKDEIENEKVERGKSGKRIKNRGWYRRFVSCRFSVVLADDKLDKNETL